MVRFGVCGQLGLHGLAVELAVDLGARAAHGRRPWSGSAGGTGCRPRRPAGPSAPSRASISRTRWPLPRPPMAGLQHISPMVSSLWVSSRVRAPSARRGRRGLAAGVAAADDDDVPRSWTAEELMGAAHSRSRPADRHRGRRRLFHVKHGSRYLPMQKLEKTRSSTSSASMRAGDAGPGRRAARRTSSAASSGAPIERRSAARRRRASGLGQARAVALRGSRPGSPRPTGAAPDARRSSRAGRAAPAPSRVLTVRASSPLPPRRPGGRGRPC